jgi:cell division protein ZapA
MEKTAYTKVTILGEEYRIAGEADGAPVPELAAFVDRRMNELRRQSAIPDARRIAVLTSLNLADELFRERARRQTLQTEIDARLARIGSALRAIPVDPDGDGSAV